MTTAWTSAKFAVVAPMPMASVRTATVAKPGLRRTDRAACWMSWIRRAIRS
jgi:hypothetical protein